MMIEINRRIYIDQNGKLIGGYDMIKETINHIFYDITDGKSDYTPEEASNGLPILWLITGDKKSPWGRCVKI